MAKKKITVLGDTADESLTPEEEHKLEEKIDAMLDPSRPDVRVEEAANAAAEAEPAPEKPREKILVLDGTADAAPESIDAAAESVARSAPPLPKAHKKVNITVRRHDEPVEPEEKKPASDTVDLASEELSIAALSQEIPDPQEDTPAPEEVDEPAEDAVEPEAGTLVDEPAEDEPTAPENVEPVVKKYRPPDGPLPFKRAEPQPDESLPASLDDKAARNVSNQLAAGDEATSQVFDAHAEAQKPAKKTHKKRTALTLLAILIVIIVALCAVPKTRAMLLNTAHVQGSLSVTIVDGKTNAPLSGVNVQVGTVAATTDGDGKATLRGLKLGTQTLTLQKTAFAPLTKSVFLGWKSTAPAAIGMQLTGTEYTLQVVDFLSGLPVPAPQATSGSSAARGNSRGQVTIAIAKGVTSSPVTVTAIGYKDTKLQLPGSSSQPINVKLTPAGSDVFVLRQGGTYNVYKVDIDGQNKKLLLAGSGNESSHMNLVASPDDKFAALVSTRDDKRDKAGYLLDTLTLVNIQTGASTTVDHAQDIQVVGWDGNSMVYTALQPDVAATSTSRYELYSYDAAAQKRIELDHASDFNDVIEDAAYGTVYYATASQSGSGTTGLFSISFSGRHKQQLLAADVANIFRTGYHQFVFATGKQWYSYKAGDTKPVATSTGYSGTSRLYSDNRGNTSSARIDSANKQVLLYSQASGSEKMLAQQSGLEYPLHWLNPTTLVYRVATAAGASDYAVSTLGGSPQKITAVTDVDGQTLWNN